MGDQDIVLTTEIDGAFEEFEWRNRGCGIVGIIESQNLCLSADLRRNRVQIYQKAVLAKQRHLKCGG